MPAEESQGANDCQAAMFIFKNDGVRKDQAWTRAKSLSNVRCELHVTSTSFIQGVQAWGARVDPLNSFLAVYAHMGQPGMAPTPSGPIVTWREFASALPLKVHTLWLAGCKSEHALEAWPLPSASPVSGSLLITDTKEDWMPLVDLFAREVTLDEITFFDEMQALLRSLLGTDAVTYLDAQSPSAWRPFPSRETTARAPLTPEEIAQLGSLLWGR